jgi:hypothetical protein
MKLGDYLICFLIGFMNISQCANEQLEHEKVLSRKKRYLIFPEGSSFSIAVCMTIGVYGNPQFSIFSWALNYGFAYELPTNATIWLKLRREYFGENIFEAAKTLPPPPPTLPPPLPTEATTESTTTEAPPIFDYHDHDHDHHDHPPDHDHHGYFYDHPHHPLGDPTGPTGTGPGTGPGPDSTDAKSRSYYVPKYYPYGYNNGKVGSLNTQTVPLGNRNYLSGYNNNLGSSRKYQNYGGSRTYDQRSNIPRQYSQNINSIPITANSNTYPYVNTHMVQRRYRRDLYNKLEVAIGK